MPVSQQTMPVSQQTMPVSQPTISRPQAKQTYINFRTDAVFMKAAGVINSMFSLNSTNILQVLQQEPTPS
jgi:hypothetical protein